MSFPVYLKFKLKLTIEFLYLLNCIDCVSKINYPYQKVLDWCLQKSNSLPFEETKSRLINDAFNILIFKVQEYRILLIHKEFIDSELINNSSRQIDKNLVISKSIKNSQNNHRIDRYFIRIFNTY